MDETSKDDSSKLAPQITGKCGDNLKEELQSHSDEAGESTVTVAIWRQS